MKKLYPRELYLRKIRGFYDEDEIIKVITGVRRCGKSSLLEMIIAELKAKKIPDKNIIMIHLDKRPYKGVKTVEDLEKIMEPQFDRLNTTITDFGNMATHSQKEAMSQVVNAFVREMNQSLGGTFLQLNESFNKAYSAQQKNEQLLGGIHQRAEMNQQLLYQEQEYLTDLAQYRASLAEASAALNAQLQQQEALMTDLRRVLSQMNKTLTTSYENAENAWSRTADAVDDLREVMELNQKSRARR